MPGADPAWPRARAGVPLRADGRRAPQFVTPLVRREPRRREGLRAPVLAYRRGRDGPYPAVARGRPRGGGPGDGGPDGQDGGRPRRRSGLDAAAGLRQAGADRPGDEPADVGARRRRGATWRGWRRTGCAWSARIRATWPAARSAPGAWPSRTRSWPRSRLVLAPPARPLAGLRAVVTSGPTREPLDPVRYLSNHSSGRQGHAIARAWPRPVRP